MSAEQHLMSTQSIVFPNGNQAQAVFFSPMGDTQNLPALLHIPSFSSVIMIMGGAALMEDSGSAHPADLFTHGVALLAATHNALIIDGGTQAGVMELMGIGVAEQHRRSPLLGIAPAELVTYPGQLDRIGQKERVSLDTNHSHFVLVETDEWGGETAIMYELAHIFSQGRPSIAIVVNGGAIAIQETLYNVRQQRPIIVLQGSGRAADDIARLWQEKPSAITDPHLAEIIQHGQIHLFPVTGSASELMQLMRQLLQ